MTSTVMHRDKERYPSYRGAIRDSRIAAFANKLVWGLGTNGFSMADRGIWNLFEQLPQILKHGVFYLRARAIGDTRAIGGYT